MVTILESISDGFFSLDRQFRVDVRERNRGAGPSGRRAKRCWAASCGRSFPRPSAPTSSAPIRRAMTERRDRDGRILLSAPERMVRGARLSLRGRHQRVFQGRHGAQEDRTGPARKPGGSELGAGRRPDRELAPECAAQRAALVRREPPDFRGAQGHAPCPTRRFSAIVHPEDREYVDRKWQAALRGEPYDIEHRIVVGNAVKWVRERAELEFDADGQLLGGFGITQDISIMKRADEALRESEARFRLLARTAEELLAARDPQEHIG
ncbi:MAG: PAS domain-containing protein [Desulfobacterales bacterium]|nr:PAS domain-containing protein [Desulfobacterales bacterium]